MPARQLLALFAPLLVTLTCSAPPAAAATWGTWDEERPPGEAAEAPLPTLPFLGALRLYQVLLSSQDLPSCPMHPSCSRFAVQAFRTYDPVQAFLLTADRLVRDGSARYPDYPWVRVGSELRLYDPPEDRRLW